MAETPPIYMDNHASTRVDPRVVEAMLPYFTERYGNASSRSHAYGWQAEEAIDAARAAVARLFGAETSAEIVFTSGGTEADNLAIKGVAHFYRDRGDHIVTQKTEHKAILDSCKRLEREGFRVTYLGVDRDGRVDPEDVRRAITDRTILTSIMLCNNEVGTVQPLAEIGSITRERGVLLHSDAVQGTGLIPFDVQRACVDLASISSHKLHGPKGVGALYVRRANPRVRLIAELDGGGQEQGVRGGTYNVPGIVGLGVACAILADDGPKEGDRLRALRRRLHGKLAERIDGLRLNGAPDPQRHPGNLNVSFEGVEGEALLTALKRVAVSSGSACTSASLEPSYVLRAMGVPDALAHASIRFGLGRFNTDEEVDVVADAVAAQVKRIRGLHGGDRLD
jgi:cysteine desulfurase